MVACGCLWLLGLSGCLWLPVVAWVEWLPVVACPDDGTDTHSDTEAVSGGWNSASVLARMHQPSDHIQQVAMCLFCFKLAEPLVLEGSAIPSAHACGARVRQCGAAAVQEGLRGLALAVPPLAKDLGRLRRATVAVLLRLLWRMVVLPSPLCRSWWMKLSS